MSKSVYENPQPLDFDAINAYELGSRPSKVTIKDFAAPLEEDDSLKGFLDKLQSGELFDDFQKKPKNR